MYPSCQGPDRWGYIITAIIRFYIPIKKNNNNNKNCTTKIQFNIYTCIPNTFLLYTVWWCCTVVVTWWEIAWKNRLSGDRKFITPHSQDLYTRGTAKTKTRPQHPYIQHRRDDVARSLCVFYRTTSVLQTWKRLVPFMPVQQSYPAHSYKHDTEHCHYIYIIYIHTHKHTVRPAVFMSFLRAASRCN